MSRKRATPPPSPERIAAPAPSDPVEALIARARRSRRRGDDRATLVALRLACALDEWRPRTHAIFGAELARQHHVEEAREALNRARWLRARAGDTARASSTARLASSLLPKAA